MPVVAVPDVVVPELVQVGVEPALVVHVDVRNEELQDELSISLPTQDNLMPEIVLYIF